MECQCQQREGIDQEMAKDEDLYIPVFRIENGKEDSYEQGNQELDCSAIGRMQNGEQEGRYDNSGNGAIECLFQPGLHIAPEDQFFRYAGCQRGENQQWHIVLH